MMPERAETVQVVVKAQCCGVWLEFDDFLLGSMESQACARCARRVEVSLDGFTQWVSPGRARARPSRWGRLRLR